MVRVRTAPHPQERSGAPKGRLRLLGRRNPKAALGLTVKWNGGSQDWIEVESRGCVIRVPGNLTVFDLVMKLNRVSD